MLHLLFISATVAAAAIAMFYLIRRKLRVSVKCWCCGWETRVRYDVRNSWDCIKCDQYNGFTEDGDFNKDIPAMYDERLNGCVRTAAPRRLPKPDVTHLTSATNGLCHQCNLNQILKVRQLATFVPTCEEAFDDEVDKYRRRLEQIYALCERCRTFVSNELTYQSQKYGFAADLLNFRRFSAKSVGDASKRTFSAAKELVQKRRKSVGTVATGSAAACCLLSISIWICDFHNVQRDSKTELIPLDDYLPVKVVNALPQFYARALISCICGAVFQLSWIFFRKTPRTSLDFFATSLWAVDLMLHAVNVSAWNSFSGGGKEDLYVWQFFTSTWLAFFVSAAFLLSDRRRRNGKNHKKTRSSQNNRSAVSSDAFSERSSYLTKSSRAQSDKSGVVAGWLNRGDFHQQQQQEDNFTSPRATREGSPSRVLGAKLSTLCLSPGRHQPSVFNGQSFTPLTTKLSVDVNSGPSVAGYPKRTASPILAPPKFTPRLQSTPANHLWSNNQSQQLNQLNWWSKNTEQLTSKADDDTVSLLSGFSSTSRRIKPAVASAPIPAIAQPKSAGGGEWFWKAVVGLVLVLSMSTNVAVLYHVLVKK